ncbi:MAG: beta-mannosidase, partial [Sphingobacteriales bacterium]
MGGLKGFMIRGRYDVTKLVNKSGVNVVAVLLYPLGENFNNLEMPSYMGANGWDWTPPIPGRDMGITDKVYLSASENVTIVDPWIRTRELSNGNTSAKLSFTAGIKNHADVAQNVVVAGVINPGNIRFTGNIPLAAKEFKTFAPADFVMNNAKLWWPNGYGEPNLYSIKLTYDVGGKLSDSTSFKFGIRKYDYKNDKNGVFNLYINGTRIYVKGGNWGMSDFMLKVRVEDYDARIRFHKEMNMNMIRTWIGCVTDEEFYDYCDKYGIMVWEDYWLNNRFTFLNDEKMFLANVSEKLKRLRNRASIAVWCGANENVPFQDLNLQDSTLKYDGGDRLYQSSSSNQNNLTPNIKMQFGMPKQGGLSGSGPWNNENPSTYFTGLPRGTKKPGEAPEYVGYWGFRSEIGAVSFPNVESFKKFMPKEDWWPRNEMW